MSLVQQGRSAVGFLSNNRQKLAGLTSAMLGVLVRKGKQAMMKQQSAYKSSRGLEISSQNSRTSGMARGAQPRFKRGARSRKSRKSGKSKATGDPERTAVSVGKLKRKSSGGSRVKVTKKFKAAVKQIIENAPHPGVYETLNAGYIQAVTTGTQGLQTVGYISTFPSGNNLFSPVLGLHAASRLYNSKLPLAAASNPGLGDANNFNGQNFEMNVVSNYGVMKIKSNSHRAYALTFYICTPKIQQNIEAPLGCWEGALQQEAIAGILPDSFNNGFGTAGGAVSIQKLYQDPRMCPQFNRYFKVETKKVVLHPGEFTEFTVPLFKGKLQFEKYYLDGAFQTVQKECTYMFYTCYTDLVLNNAAINAAVRTNENAAHAICWELQTKMKLSIPEQAGFTYTGTTTLGTRQPLTARIAKRVYDHYYPLSSNGTTLIDQALTTKTRIDPVQPATDEGTG